MPLYATNEGIKTNKFCFCLELVEDKAGKTQNASCQVTNIILKFREI